MRNMCSNNTNNNNNNNNNNKHMHDSHGPVKMRHSADSFDGEINALPGIGDNMILAENDDDDLASCDSLFGDDDQDDDADARSACRGGA